MTMSRMNQSVLVYQGSPSGVNHVRYLRTLSGFKYIYLLLFIIINLSFYYYGNYGEEPELSFF
jgi:hypothetical protein